MMLPQPTEWRVGQVPEADPTWQPTLHRSRDELRRKKRERDRHRHMTLAAVLTGCDRVQSCDRAVHDLRQPTTTECDRAYERRPPLGADRTSIIKRAPTRHEDLATPADARRRPGNGDYVGDGLCVIRIRTRRTSIALGRDPTATIISGRRLTRWISSAQRHLDSGW